MILLGLLLAAFAINLDTTIVNVALPTLVRELGASTTQLEWIVDAYNLAFAALVLAAGNLGDRRGRKGVLLAGLVVFGLAALGGGFGRSGGELIAARAVMGVGAALIFPATLSLLTNVFTERSERARAIGLWGATTGVGIALGPIVGGWLLEHFSWSSVFFALAPVAGLAAVLVAFQVPTSRDPTAPRADWAGVSLSTTAMVVLTYTVIEAPTYVWIAPRTLAGFGASLLLGVLFVLQERRTAAPMLDVALFRNLRFTAASGAVAITFFSLMGFIFVITLYFQFLKGYGALSTGIRLLPVAMTVGVTSVLGTRVAVRHGTKGVVAAGLICLAIGLAWASTSSTTTSYLQIAATMVFIGSGIGLTSAPATESIMGAVSAARAGIGSAINDATRILGGTIGVAVIGSIYTSLYATRLAHSLPATLPPPLARTAQRSVGGAFAVADHVDATRGHALGEQVRSAASAAFFHGLQTAVLVAAAVAMLGAVFAAILIPRQPRGVDAERAQGVAAR